MEYEGQICRAPMERGAFMLPVMVGCSYNRCKFCTLFKHLSYRELPMEQIEDELKRVKAAGGNPRRIFLGDGNAFCLKTERFMRVLELIGEYFSDFEGVHMDAAVSSVQAKTDEELKDLYKAGVRRVYVGIESGLDDVLLFMKKDHTNGAARREIARLREAGIIYDAHIMTGVAGSGRGLENAEATARFLNETRPGHIVNFSMFVTEDAPLYKDVKSGAFTPASELESLEEAYRLVQLLDIPGGLYDGFHDLVGFRVRGRLPEEKDKMLARLAKKIEEQKKNLCR